MSLVDSVTKAFVPIHREGWPFIAISLVATLVIGWFADPLFWIGLIVTAWVCYFFRDPPRVTPVTEGLIISPADGVVSHVGPARPPAELELSGEPLLRVRDLKVTFRQRRGVFARPVPVQAVDGVSFDVAAGETVAVVGASGSGKTTCGRGILRLARASGGSITFDGRDLLAAGRRDMAAFRLACQLVSQDPYSSLDPRMRVADIVAESLRIVPGLDGAERRARVEQALAEVGLGDFAARLPHQLSGGQRQRVAIARALVRRPRLIIADEPVSALDMTIQKQILDLFTPLQRSHGFSCLFISHDLAAVRQIADRVIVMKDGQVVEAGEIEQIYRAPTHPYTQRLLEASPGLQLSLRRAGGP